MWPRRTHGTSLLEVVLVVSIGAVVLAGAAAYFRTLRQASDLVHARREALQSARVALDRMSRRIRAGKLITAISSPADPAGSVTVRDFNDISHVFALAGAELRYGVDSASHLLAAGIQSVCFQGHDSQGTVPYDQPARMDAVAISLTAAIAGTSETISLTTRVRLRRDIDYNQTRATTSYATAYQKTSGDGILNYQLAFGVPDGQYASGTTNGGGRFYGFQPEQYTGTVHRIFAGFRMRYHEGDMRLMVRYDTTDLLDKTYASAELAHLADQWAWWWIDVTDKRPAWTEADMDNLSIGVSDVTKALGLDFDCFAIRAFFDPPVVTEFWADRPGDGACPNHWVNGARALGEPDDQYAEGLWASQDWQSFRTTAPITNDEVLAVHVRLDAYLESSISNDCLEVWTASPSDPTTSGVRHVIPAPGLQPLAGYANRGTLLVDATNDRGWTWSDLNDREVRFHLVPQGGADTVLLADAVAWRVLHVGRPGKGIRIWQEP